MTHATSLANWAKLVCWPIDKTQRWVYNVGTQAHTSARRIPKGNASMTKKAQELAPTFNTFDELDTWAWDNLPNGIARHITEGGVSRRAWNDKYAGLTVAEIETKLDFYR